MNNALVVTLLLLCLLWAINHKQIDITKKYSANGQLSNITIKVNKKESENGKD